MGPPEWGHDDDPCQPLPLTQMVATDYGSTGEGLTVFRAGWLGAAGGVWCTHRTATARRLLLG